jgi:hypothetical protein
MNLISIRSDLDKDYLIALGDFQAHRFQGLVNFLSENHPAVLRWTD